MVQCIECHYRVCYTYTEKNTNITIFTTSSVAKRSVRVLVNFVMFVFFEDMYNIREVTLNILSHHTMLYFKRRDTLKSHLYIKNTNTIENGICMRMTQSTLRALDLHLIIENHASYTSTNTIVLFCCV